jgi:hypothetical protein
MSWDLPGHKNPTFLTVHMKILPFLQWEKISTRTGQQSTSHKQEATGDGDEYA